jgi:anti-anti-sigma factor
MMNASDLSVPVLKSITTTDDEMTIVLTGDLDLYSVPKLASVVTDTVAADNPKRVIIDMGAVDFIDSFGLVMVLGLYKVRPEPHWLQLIVVPGSQPDRVLRISCFDRYMDIGSGS